MKLKRSPEAAWRKIDDAIVVVTPRDGKLHQLNDTASFIWELLENEPEESSIPDAVCAEFETDPDTARADAEAFIAEMVEKKLIERI